MTTSTYDLSWGETSFLAKLKLFFKSNQQETKKIQSHVSETRAEGYSALSSTYYSIVGTAFAQYKEIKTQFLDSPPYIAYFVPLRFVAWGFTWLPLAAWCYWRMLPLSDCVVTLIGYNGMSADQCDVRQSILRRRGKYDEARKCIHAGFTKNVEKAHTRGLLCVGLADIYLRNGDLYGARDEMDLALLNAKQAEKQDPRQAARIYRHCANIIDVIKQGDPVRGNLLREKARALAQEAGAQDQLLKL